MFEDLTDLKLVERVRENDDRAAFRELMKRYRGKAYGISFGMVRNREDALDLVQEAFVKAYYGLKSFKGQSKFSLAY